MAEAKITITGKPEWRKEDASEWAGGDVNCNLRLNRPTPIVLH